MPLIHEKHSQPIRKNRSILIVDDDLITLEMMELFLRDASYNVFAASCLEEALKIAANNQIDLVISDLGLPDGSGLDLMEDLRNRNVKGIVVTGYDKENEEAKKAGFSDFLTKPVDVDYLLSVVRSQINS